MYSYWETKSLIIVGIPYGLFHKLFNKTLTWLKVSTQMTLILW